jgi:xanthine dehydrogenase iron-sulfur cluster and FAD-binding subunit A
LKLEGLGTAESLHALQRAFISEQAAQCGYCISGMIMAGKALLDKNPSPTVADIKRALWHRSAAGRTRLAQMAESSQPSGAHEMGAVQEGPQALSSPERLAATLAP